MDWWNGNKNKFFLLKLYAESWELKSYHILRTTVIFHAKFFVKQFHCVYLLEKEVDSLFCQYRYSWTFRLFGRGQDQGRLHHHGEGAYYFWKMLLIVAFEIFLTKMWKSQLCCKTTRWNQRSHRWRKRSCFHGRRRTSNQLTDFKSNIY